MHIHETIEKIEKFSRHLVLLEDPLEENLFSAFEKKFKLVLPSDYKTLLRKYNGIDLLGANIYGIRKAYTLYDLEACYIVQHFEVKNNMPTYLVPFSSDGNGNFYCFDTRIYMGDSCAIVFWQSNYPYSEVDRPEVVNDSLTSWINEVVINWTLELCDFDGTEKRKEKVDSKFAGLFHNN